MAFALTKFEARGINYSGPSKKRGVQQAYLKITGLVGDVSLGLGDDSGTFWTAALADATYGAMAAKVQAILQRITANAVGLLDVKSEQLLDRLQAAAAAGTSYTLAIQDHRPNIVFAAGQGETFYDLVLEWELNEGIFPETASYG